MLYFCSDFQYSKFYDTLIPGKFKWSMPDKKNCSGSHHDLMALALLEGHLLGLYIRFMVIKSYIFGILTSKVFVTVFNIFEGYSNCESLHLWKFSRHSTLVWTSSHGQKKMFKFGQLESTWMIAGHTFKIWGMIQWFSHNYKNKVKIGCKTEHLYIITWQRRLSRSCCRTDLSHMCAHILTTTLSPV